MKRKELEAMTEDDFEAWLEAESAKQNANLARRKRLRKRDANNLLSLNDSVVGMAAKEFFAVGAEVQREIAMTDEAWYAYGLIVSLVFDDWDTTEDC